MTIFSIAGQPVYPHIKLTRETFPRALATRILKGEGDEYFGAFLGRTAVRILIDFLNRTFRLRSCTISIDGNFPVPCTQYYAKRCVAPCVSSLCDRDQYLEIVNLVRQFLRNERELFLAEITTKIERASEALDFETAAFFRDMLQNVEGYWAQRRQVWLDDTVDTLELSEDDQVVSVIIISQRRQSTLGTIVYDFPKRDDVPTTVQALRDVIAQFYKYHLPRAIRVSHDFEGRTVLAKKLGSKFGRKITIQVIGDATRRVTTERALAKTKDRLDLDAISARRNTVVVQAELKEMFGLPRRPLRIEAFDVAHISATGFAAAVSVWINGGDVPDEYEHWLSDQTSELQSLRTFLAQRLTRSRPDLILIDGGLSHLNAALDTVPRIPAKRPAVIAAVKPRGKHSSISHFLIESGRRVEFDVDSNACRLLQRLRDEAHDLANATHRLSRDMLHFYEPASITPSLNEGERQDLLRDVGSIKKIGELDTKDLDRRYGNERGAIVMSEIERWRRGEAPIPAPLIVPIRYVETDGAAEDLRPIETR